MGARFRNPARAAEYVANQHEWFPPSVTPRSGGEVAVTSPLAGRLAGVNLPALGTHVLEGQVLATVVPPTSVPNDRASLDLAKAEAEAQLDYAKRDREEGYASRRSGRRACQAGGRI